MRRQLIKGRGLGLLGAIAIAAITEFSSISTAAPSKGTIIAPGLALPSMNAEHGKELFASKGCVVCHAINGVGGTDAPSLDASTMDPVMNPFDFFPKCGGALNR